MNRRWIVVGLLLLGAGCNRSDAECLGRIGHLVAHRFDRLKPTAGAEPALNRSLPDYGGPDEKADAAFKDK